MGSQKRIIAITLSLLLLGGGSAYAYFRQSHRFEDVATTSKSKTAQANYNDGEERKNNSAGNVQDGGAVDMGGADVPSEAPGIVSASGVISVKQPAKDEILTDGSIIGGTAKDLTQVQYRLIDNKVGVIGQGSLKVVNGMFSGKLQFSAKADSGRLDIFSYGNVGEEINYVEIPVGFK